MGILSQPIGVIAEWLRNLFLGWGLSEGLTTVLLYLIGAGVLATLVQVWVIFLIWFERKIIGRFQDRLGPNRVGPYGLLQPFADLIKIITKEVIIPRDADKAVYLLGPIIMDAGVLAIWAVIPLMPMVGMDVNVAALYTIAVGAFATLGILMAGWASNNKFALLSAFRTVAQMISYEVPTVLALLIPVMLAGTMSLQGIVEAQHVWYIVFAPLAFVIYFIASVAEVGRTPFDLLEAESEIVAGFHIEYSGMVFAIFYVGDFLHAFTIGALGAVLFLGGWRGPGAETFPLLGLLYLWIKAFLVYFLVVWARGSLPRVRIDQMMDFSWKFLTPLALILLVVAAVLDHFVMGFGMWGRALSHFAANVVIAVLTLRYLDHYDKVRESKRRMVAQPGQYPVARPPVPVETSTEAAS
ncbi:MAG: NADH-quinone oxidoreductase subunit NuoH [Chloroflexi bacterium]|nr:NADH-quinone oxidoreductase subunit NuoH [Chloroflexota bacterium]